MSCIVLAISLPCPCGYHHPSILQSPPEKSENISHIRDRVREQEQQKSSEANLQKDVKTDFSHMYVTT
jgi:hypothetical protein